ncbi:tRNA nucleotidyltransferase/poly(A) polymerase family protein [Anaerosinus massiliensis]|uniref:polynucleotide adenylyltransferase n=1 Tax=Massilibacillus massiliensis TaxID=1806837 RepID=UPI000A5AE7B5|nr:polynucleotide adenylyltransferase [Massilibacillus massiliensis]
MGLTERQFAEIVAEHGGRVFRVGGSVRDHFMRAVPKDIDFSVVGMVKKNFKLLFPDAQECGKSFPVFLLAIDGIKREVAFARTEKKVGTGYKGFRVSAKPKITIEEDLYRRDTTVNSMAQDALTGEIIDPYGGRADIEAKILRATSEHFSDDPIRALRLAGQAARFNFTVDPGTLPLMSATKEELAEEPVERIVAELGKVLSEAQKPAMFFEILARTALLSVTFAELANISEAIFAKAMTQLNAVAHETKDAKIRFAAFGVTLDKERLTAWNTAMTLPNDWLNAASIVNELITELEKATPEKIFDAMQRLRRGSLNLEEFDLITKGTNLNVLQLCPLKKVMVLPKDEAIPPELKGKEIGEWLKQKQIALLKNYLSRAIE